MLDQSRLAGRWFYAGMAAVLTAAALWLRRRPAAHRRLMLLASVGGFAPASMAHFVVYFGLSPLVTLLVVTGLLFAPAVRDRLSSGRAHPVSLYGGAAVVSWAVLAAAVVGPSSAWRRLVEWMIG